MTIEELDFNEEKEEPEEEDDEDIEGQFLEAVTLLQEAGDALKEVRKYILKLDRTMKSKVVTADLASLLADIEMFIESVE